MESLLLYVLNLTYQETRMDVAEVLQFSQKYFNSSGAITIVSFNLSPWINASMTKTVLLQHSKKLSKLSSTSVILDFTLSSQNDWDSIELLQWTASTMFFVLTEGNEAQDIVNYFYANSVCNMIVVAAVSNGIKAFRPEFQYCDLAPTILQHEKIDMLKSVINPCFENRILNVSFMDFPPFVIYKEGSRLSGMEGAMIEVVADKLKFSLNYINQHETGWGQFDPPEGLQGDVAKGPLAFGVGGLFPFLYRSQNADAISHTAVIQLSFAAPVAAGQTHPTWFIILISEFTLTVWFLIFTVFWASVLLSMVPKHGKRRHDLLQWPFHNLALFLGIPLRLIQPRILSLTCIIGGFLITSYYQTKMSSSLTAPPKIPDIRTLKELAESSLNIQGPISAKNLVQSFADDSQDVYLLELARRYNATSESFKEALAGIVHNRNLAYFRHKLNMLHVAAKNPETVGKIHVVEQSVLEFKAVALITKHSCLSPLVKTTFQTMHEAGFSNKWLRDASEFRHAHHDSGPRKLSLADIKGFLCLVMFGWSFSVTAFLFELIIAKKWRSAKSIKKALSK